MAVTILAQPDRVHPGYNPIYYWVDSTNKNLPGFRYIFEIKLCSPSTTIIRELKVAPRPGDKYGYADISKIIQDYLKNALDVNSTSWIDADDFSDFEYQVDFGEEYIESYELYTAISTGLTGSLIAPSNSTFMTGTSSMPFIVGDQVFVNIDSGYTDCRAGIEGFWTVNGAVVGVGLLTINYNTFCVGSQNISGSYISYADNRKIRVTGLTSSSCSVAFNAAYSFADFKNYDENQIICTTFSSEILTNAPNKNFSIYTWQNLYWNFFDDQTDNVGTILFENSNGSQFLLDTCASRVPVTIPYIKQVDVSPTSAAILYSGSSSQVVMPDTEWYDIQAIDNCGCGLPDSVTLIFNTGGGTLSTNHNPDGLYNGAYFYQFTNGLSTYFLWYDTILTTFVVTDALGSTATLYVNGTIAPSNLPYVFYGSSTGGDWNVISFTYFETAPCVPDLTQTTSEKRRIYIDRRCPINETQILFMDRAGSWSSFAFTLREKRNITSEKRNYRKEFGYLDQNPSPNIWTYDLTDAGEVTYNVTTEKTYTLTTDWMNDAMSVYFEELITSPETYLKSDETGGSFLRCIVLTNQVETQRSKNTKLINKTINIKLAVNENINI